jgi:lipopolysaccharide export system permease protein
MKRLYLYLIKRFIGPFILTFFVCIFFLLMQFLWKYLDELVGKGLETSVIVELMFYAAMNLVPMAFPLSVLMASVMTFGNLGERFELIAIKASGVSLLKIMKPLIIFNIIVTFIAFLLANEVIPVTNAKFAALLWSVRSQRPEMIVKEGIFSNEIDGYSIKVNKRSDNSDLLYGIMIYDHTEGKGNVAVAIADSGYLNMSDDKQFMILTLFSGESYTDIKPGSRENIKTYPFRRERFDKEELIINVKDYDLKRTDESFFKNLSRMLKNRQLARIVDSLEIMYVQHEKMAALGIGYNNTLNETIVNHFKADSLKSIPIKKEEKIAVVNFDSLYSKLSNQNKGIVIETAQRAAQTNQRNIIQSDTDLSFRIQGINRHLIEWHRKYTLSLACIIFFFIGAPLGAIIRKGGFGTPVVVSVLLFISYYLISMIGENFAREGVWSTGFSMWYSTFFFMAIGIFLSHQAITDSLLLNKEAYGRLFGRLNFMKKLFREKEEIEQNENPILDE